ncbi:hypothetical protein [Ehrlichia ruminantium]|uniref:hypothetical protein n=1 Tax=Ehrlichia ruminantium TaxID=779 RepID=UPI0007A04D55|nr:hypothetical protein [Ehrlichia ruminantium]KYW98306.1 hypothetical protein AUR40_05280 [Ehrlichia ruminantium]
MVFFNNDDSLFDRYTGRLECAYCVLICGYLVVDCILEAFYSHIYYTGVIVSCLVVIVFVVCFLALLVALMIDLFSCIRCKRQVDSQSEDQERVGDNQQHVHMAGDMSNTGGTTDCSNIDSDDVTFITPSAPPPEPTVPPPPYTLYDPNPMSFCTSGSVGPPNRQPYVVGYKV